MSNEKNQNGKGIGILLVIVIFCALALAGTNALLSDRIEEAAASQASGEMAVVMPEGKGFEEIELPAESPETVQHIFAESSGIGYVVEMATTSQYSSAPMEILMGVGKDGIITGVSLKSYNESKDFGEEYPASFVGKDSALADIDMTAGVTYSSTAFMDAVTDGYTALFALGDVAEGQKSDDQLIAEVMPLALPGACDALGQASIGEAQPGEGDVQAVYEATNDTGFIVVMNGPDSPVVCGVNAFGTANCFDLEGNELTSDPAYEQIMADAAAAVPVLTEQNAESFGKVAAKAVDEGTALTPIEALPGWGTIVGAYNAGEDGSRLFIAHPLGFANETMSMVIVLNADGEIVNYKTTSDMIVNGEYYSAHELKDESAYRTQFVGLTADTYSQDITLVTGATITAGAVHNSINDAFAAYAALKEVAE